MHKRPIGILGGMGPEASAYLYTKLIQLSVSHFGAKNNDDFPEIILQSIPVPDFISNDKNRNKAFDMLAERVKTLQSLNLSCLSIACNTAHVLLSDLQNISTIPFISMIDEVVKLVKEEKKAIIGIMGTPSTIRYKLYENEFTKSNITSLVPTEKQISKMERVIRNVLQNKQTKKDEKELFSIAQSLQKRGVQGIVLGCTELPLVFPKKFPLPVYNSVEILALALLRKYYK